MFSFELQFKFTAEEEKQYLDGSKGSVLVEIRYSVLWNIPFFTAALI